MADPTTKPKGMLDSLFNEHLTKPTGENGIGSTLGEDVSGERQRETDARNGAHDLPDDIEDEDDK
jgi:hypothetical protein